MAKKPKPLPPKPLFSESVEQLLSKLGQKCRSSDYVLSFASKITGSLRRSQNGQYRTEGEVKATARAFYHYMVAQGRDVTRTNLINTMDDEHEREEAVFGHDGIDLAPLEILRVDRVHEEVWCVNFAEEDATPFSVDVSTFWQYLKEIRNE